MSTSSIRTRLTLIYTISIFVLLAVMACLLYWVTIHFLHRADYEFLDDEVDTIQYILENKSLDNNALKEAVIYAPLHPSASIYHYYIRVFDENHQLMIESKNTSNVMPQEKVLHEFSKILGKKRYFWYSKNNNDYLLIQSPVRFGNKPTQGMVQITLDITYQHDMIRNLKSSIGLLFGGVLIALLIGFLMAKRSLHSLYLLTETVQKITGSSLDQRIDPKAWPKELRGIGVAFNQMLDRLEASFLRLKQFSADLSHEMRTPVNNLIGTTEIALSKYRTIDDYRDVMASNLEELQRISSLIENILFLARAENPHIELHKKHISVENEIALVCDYYQAMAEEKNIVITREGAASLLANPDMFRRMISNILSNAIKYTPAGSSVKFSISESSAQKINITLTDNGCGIAAEHLPKLFDRFYRIDAARSLQSGTGLGLAIVKSIIDLHQGTISVTSVIAQGTTIVIQLPK